MKKPYYIPLLGLLALLCAGGLLWRNAARSDLLPNDLTSGSVEIGDKYVPLTDAPDLSPTEEPEADPFAQFTQEQRDTINEVLTLVNQARTEAGAVPLELDPALCGAAQVRAAECVTTFSHTRPNGSSYKTAVAEAGVTSGYIGENAATGQKSAQQVVNSWLNSEGHRANILNGNYAKIGIGFAPNTGNRYQGYAWVQLFTD